MNLLPSPQKVVASALFGLLMASPASAASSSFVDVKTHPIRIFTSLQRLADGLIATRKLNKGDRVLLMPIDADDADNALFEEALTSALTKQGISVLNRPSDLPDGSALFESLKSRYKVNRLIQYRWSYHGNEGYRPSEEAALFKISDTGTGFIIWSDIFRYTRTEK